MDIRIKVGVVVTDEDGRVLLIKEKYNEYPTPRWNIIKGTFDGDETISDAAKRECREEASLEVDLLRALGVYMSEESGKVRVQFNFLARAHNTRASVAMKEEQALRGELIE